MAVDQRPEKPEEPGCLQAYPSLPDKHPPKYLLIALSTSTALSYVISVGGGLSIIGEGAIPALMIQEVVEVAENNVQRNSGSD